MGHPKLPRNAHLDPQKVAAAVAGDLDETALEQAQRAPALGRVEPGLDLALLITGGFTKRCAKEKRLP